MAKSKQSTKPEALLEISYGDSALRVDREKGVIHGVKLLGRVSRNGYEYSDQALREAASFYEGIGVNIDHPDRKTPGAERGLRDRFGEIRGVETKADGVYGDLHYLTKHPLAESVAEAAERFPRQLGMSHNADGVKARKGGKVVIESVERVRSVDLVGKPATNNGLFESEHEEATVKKTVKQILESAFGDKLKGSALAKLLEDDGMMGAEVEAPAAGGDSEDQIKAAFRQAVMAAFDDDKLDSKSTLAKIKEILAAYDKLSGDGKEPPKSEPATESKIESASKDPAIKALIESVNELRRERDQLRTETACRSLLESAGREVSDVRLKALSALSDEADRKALIESWPKAAAKSEPRKPGRSSSVLEGEEPGTYTRKDPKAFASSIR